MRIPKMEIILQIPTAPKRLPKTSHIHHPIAEAGQCGNAGCRPGKEGLCPHPSLTTSSLCDLEQVT